MPINATKYDFRGEVFLKILFSLGIIKFIVAIILSLFYRVNVRMCLFACVCECVLKHLLCNMQTIELCVWYIRSIQF